MSVLSNEVLSNIRGYQQQDAHEFMRYLLDKLHSELVEVLGSKSSGQSTTSIVSDIFGGFLQSDVSMISLITPVEESAGAH